MVRQQYLDFSIKDICQKISPKPSKNKIFEGFTMNSRSATKNLLSKIINFAQLEVKVTTFVYVGAKVVTLASHVCTSYIQGYVIFTYLYFIYYLFSLSIVYVGNRYLVLGTMYGALISQFFEPRYRIKRRNNF